MKQCLILGLMALAISACNDSAGPTTSLRADLVTSPLPSYQMIDLETLGGFYSGVSGINNRGQVAGTSTTADGFAHGYVWEQGAMQDLGTLGGTLTYVAGINDAGQLTGESFAPDGNSHGFLWEGGVMTDLGTLGGWSSTPTAINASGQVTGQSVTPEGLIHTFLWENGTMLDIGTLGGTRAFPADINEAGQIVGTSETSTGVYHAFRWQQGEMLDIGASLGDLVTLAVAVNENGQVILSTPTAETDVQRSFLWDDRGVREILPVPGYARVDAVALNDQGQVVGIARNTGLPDLGFLWQDGVTTLLGPRVMPRAISNLGEIVGSHQQTGDQRAFIWRNGVLSDIHPADPAYTNSVALAINANGWITGYVSIGMPTHGFLWIPQGAAVP